METIVILDGLTLTHGDDGWWLNFDGGVGKPKSSISIHALADGLLRQVERPGVGAWLERVHP